MLILLTSEQEIEHEAIVLNELFKNGLEYLHIRKPFYTKAQCIKLINQIDESYHNQIMIHQFFDLTNDFDLKGIHLKEKNRLNKFEKERVFRLIKEKGLKISTSFHSVADLKQEVSDFDYAFLSPVFDSISKQDYKRKAFDISDVEEEIVALGGVSQDNIEEVFQLGYKGIGVLGSVWGNKNPSQAFKVIKKEYNRLSI